MSFSQKTWQDRAGTNLTRRKLIDVSTEEETLIDVEKAEGAVYSSGIQFNADTMNDLEIRIKTAFDKAQAQLDATLNTFYPIGSVYISADNISPANLFGGTWVSITGGVLLSANSAGASGGNDTSSFTPRGTFNITANVGNANADIPSHSHTYYTTHYDSDDKGWTYGKDGAYAIHNQTVNTTATGGGNPHNHGVMNLSIPATLGVLSWDNRMPSITVYAWRRTA